MRSTKSLLLVLISMNDMKGGEEKMKQSHYFYSSKDFQSGMLFILFSVMVFFQTIGGNDEVMLFPKIIVAVSLIMGIGSTLVGLKTVVQKSDKTSTEPRHSNVFNIVFCVYMIIVLSAVSILGFYTCLFLVCCGCYGLLKFSTRENNGKFVGNVLLFSILATAIVYIIFRILLGITTPTGVFI